MNKIDSLTGDLPDAESASRFFEQFSEKHPPQAAKLLRNDGLLSDVLTLASFSPLLAATLLQNPEYVWWLNRKRSDSNIRNKDELLESLARLSLTNSQIEPQLLIARFRRRELLRIFLRDIRRLASVAEITEEISNLADAILENALREARQEIDNRYGSPLEIDSKGRSKPADFCVVSLGKLGSKELNYSSDIDLLFLYSAEGSTSGRGSRGTVTNREYFVRLAESITKLVGQHAGEGAAYRVDLRLRPHGRVGALALSVKDTVRYYTTEAESWERQVLIRSRSSAGNAAIFKKFFVSVEGAVFSENQTLRNALGNVRQSKEKIDFEHKGGKSYDVKLGRGGIREIEFIAQALQLAHGGKDRWLRSPHTLISLTRLADRHHLREAELTELFGAYEFLRHLEHILQMEHGLQTHTVPNEQTKRLLVSKRMRFKGLKDFETALKTHSGNVHKVFVRVFGDATNATVEGRAGGAARSHDEPDRSDRTATLSTGIHRLPPRILASFQKSDTGIDLTSENLLILQKLAEVSPRFTAMLAASPMLIDNLPNITEVFRARNYRDILMEAMNGEADFGHRLSVLRKTWSRLLLEIAVYDIFEKLPMSESKLLQTSLAEAAIETALRLTRYELSRRTSTDLPELPVAVLALGKLGGGAIDYDSDLDLVLVYDSEKPLPVAALSHPEFYARAVEIFVTTLSSMTRDGHLYRVDLRLRPHGKSGASSISKTAFIEYMLHDAAIWELLAYIKIRGVAGDIKLAKTTETAIRRAIHKRATAVGKEELKNETKRVRLRLEEEKIPRRKDKDIDIKFGPGGMLDVYFVARYLQLRDNLADDSENRSTTFMLEKLFKADSLCLEQYTILNEGYAFLSALDHNLRLTIGRSTRLPVNRSTRKIVAERMRYDSIGEMLEQLTLHRLGIRAAFESLLDS